MSRSKMQYPQNLKFQTPLGKVSIDIVATDHIYVEAGTITASRVDYHCTLHLFKQEDGSWDVEKDNNIYASRAQYIGYDKSRATPNAIKQIKQGIIPAINEWTKDNSELFTYVELAYINNQTAQLEDNIAESKRTLEAEQIKLDALYRQYAELDPNHGAIVSYDDDSDDDSDDSPITLINEAIQLYIPKAFEDGYVKSQDPDELALEALGILLSNYCHWSGDLILKLAIAALSDANFRTEAGQLQEMLDKLENTYA